ncbi:hypothetical protein HRU45_03560 [Candidatus Dependentiae bacterium]|nr:hypothetical protein [Candidatus Dependentiae bacterium]
MKKSKTSALFFSPLLILFSSFFFHSIYASESTDNHYTPFDRSLLRNNDDSYSISRTPSFTADHQYILGKESRIRPRQRVTFCDQVSQKLSKWGKALLIVGIGALSAFFIIDQIKKTENEVKQQLKPF